LNPELMKKNLRFFQIVRGIFMLIFAVPLGIIADKANGAESMVFYIISFFLIFKGLTIIFDKETHAS